MTRREWIGDRISKTMCGEHAGQMVDLDPGALSRLLEAPVVVFGASGFLGRHFHSYFKRNQIPVIGTYRRGGKPGLFAFDLDQEEMSLQFIPAQCRYAIIASGNGDIDYHRTHEDVCRREVEGTILLVHELVTRGVTPICLSTDYVFEGTRGNYRESDPTLPTTAYGRNKLAIERSMTCLTENHLIVRVGKVYGTGSEDRSMVADMADVLRRGEEARCADDQLYSPTKVTDVVAGVVALMGMGATGTFHLSSPECTSPYELARKIKGAIPGCTGNIKRVSINEISLAERRPFNTTLNADKLGARVPLRYQRVDQSLVEIAARYS